MTPQERIERARETDGDILLADGFDAAFLGVGERCCFCDGSMDAPRRALEEQAKALGFKLTIPGT